MTIFRVLQCLHCPLTSIILLITTVRWILMLSSPFYRGNWDSHRQSDTLNIALGKGKGGTWARSTLNQWQPSFYSPEGFLEKSGLKMGLEGWEALEKQWRVFKQWHLSGMQWERVGNWTRWPLGSLWVGRMSWFYTPKVPNPAWWGRKGWRASWRKWHLGQDPNDDQELARAPRRKKCHEHIWRNEHSSTRQEQSVVKSEAVAR